MSNINQKTIALIGDSLLNMPFLHYDLEKKIRENLPKIDSSLIFSNGAHNGAKIKAVREALSRSLSCQPDAVILLWDSDCCDEDDTKMSESERSAVRSEYENDLKSVIQEVSNTGAFMGEGSIMCGAPGRFMGKNQMLDEYRDLNRRIANDFNIPYIDFRTECQKYIPWIQICYKGNITEDGEHFNEKGTDIIAKDIAAVLSNWLSSQQQVVAANDVEAIKANIL